MEQSFWRLPFTTKLLNSLRSSRKVKIWAKEKFDKHWPNDKPTCLILSVVNMHFKSYCFESYDIKSKNTSEYQDYLQKIFKCYINSCH